MKKLVLYLLVLVSQIYSSIQQKFLQSISQPTHIIKKTAIQSHIIEDDKLISFVFNDTPFQISTQIFLTNQTKRLLNSQNGDDIFNKSKYNIDVKDYCQKYPTSIQSKVRSKIVNVQNFQVLKYEVVQDEKKNWVYILGSNSILYQYIFDRINIKLINQYTIDPTITKIINGQLTKNIELLQLNGQLLIISNSQIYGLDQSNIVNRFYKIQNFIGVERIVDVGIINYDAAIFWICQGDGVYIYQLQNSNSTLVLKYSHTKFSNNTIKAITFDSFSNLFFVTSAKNLYIFDPFKQSPIFKSFQIDGNCDNIKVTNLTLYLTCQYKKNRFVAQILIQDKSNLSTQFKATINRYYDQQIVEGIKNVEVLSYGRIAIIGQQLIGIIGQAANRNLLLDLANVGKQQLFFLSYSFGLIDMFYLKSYSTLQQSNFLVINQDSLLLQTFFYIPAEVQCIFSRNQLGTSVTLLTVFNTSYCPRNLYSQDEKGGALSFCQIYYLNQIAIGQAQYEHKTAKLILFICLLVLSSLMLICIGFGANISKRANKTIQSIKIQIQKRKTAGKKSKKHQSI